jgi:hypothetical protein
MLIVQLTKGQKQGTRLYNNNTHVCVVLKASPARRLNSLQRYASRLLSVAIEQLASLAASPSLPSLKYGGQDGAASCAATMVGFVPKVALLSAKEEIKELKDSRGFVAKTD